MVSKETFTQHLAHEMAQAVVHRERYGWPPDSPWGLFQPTRPEETEKIAVKEEQQNVCMIHVLDNVYTMRSPRL